VYTLFYSGQLGHVASARFNDVATARVPHRLQM